MHRGKLNPDFALGRGIRRRRPDFFFLKKFGRCPSIDLTFFVEKAAASYVSHQRLCRPRCRTLCARPVLTPNAKSGLKQ
jgi:hypothetical protein